MDPTLQQVGVRHVIEIYTDGACRGNPGPGGWAAVILEDGSQRELHGKEAPTTNNRMELLAVIKGLAAVPQSAEVTVYSDSTYVVNTMTKGWKRKANQDLWARLDAEVQGRRVGWRWVRGHAGNPLNERADELASREAGSRAGNPSGGDTGPSGARGRPLRSGVDGESGVATLSHVDPTGKARMVDVGWKPDTKRTAVASGSVVMKPETLALVRSNDLEKGDVLGVARLAGIMAAKQTSQLIPLCHPLPLDQVAVDFDLEDPEARADGQAVLITATASTTAKTGVEMEALTAVSVAALTIYDMCKSVDRGMRIEGVRLLRKSGGMSGDIDLQP